MCAGNARPSASTSPGNAAVPTACEKNASPRSTIHVPIVPAATARISTSRIPRWTNGSVSGSNTHRTIHEIETESQHRFDGTMQTVTDSWAEHAAHQLGKAGYRRGGSRAAVIALLARQTCALSAPEINEKLSAAGTNVGRASIYRA